MPVLRVRTSSTTSSPRSGRSASSSRAMSASTSATSATSRGSPRKSQSQARPKSPKPAEERFVVGTILARSLDRGYRPDGEFEHQYLVRWEGYGPEEDTWEMRGNLLEGAEELVEAFDAGDHPFTILEARGIRARTYRIRYCFESEDVPASPFAQEMWHASWQIKTKGGIRVEAVDATVREFELRNTPGMTPRQVRLLKDRCILDILDLHVKRSKADRRKRYRRYRVRYRDQRKVAEEWMDLQKMRRLFGDEARQVVDEFEGRRPEGDDEPVVVLTTDYEDERLRNIQDNLALMRELGL